MTMEELRRADRAPLKAFSPSQMRKWRGTIAGSKFGVYSSLFQES
jgi:hypothetical protein